MMVRFAIIELGTKSQFYYFNKKENDKMKDYVEERVLNVAQYILDTKSTIRKTAKEFGVSKSTIHNDILERLPKINKQISKQVQDVVNINKAERHLRGGASTKLKYFS